MKKAATKKTTRAKKATRKVTQSKKARKPVKAARTRSVVRKVVKKKTAKPKTKTKRKPTKAAAKLKAHRDKCTICNHPDLKEIDTRILKCQRAAVIAGDYLGLSNQAVLRHMHAMGLDHKRVGDTLNFCDEVMSRTLERKGSPSFTDAARCAEMAAKIRGKLKPDESKIDVTIKLEEQVKKQMANLVAAIGGVPDGASVPE